MYKSLLPLVFLIACIFSCKRHVNTTETVVYTNDFENGNISNIENSILSPFNNSTVLGQYNSNANKGYFKLTLAALPKHDLITITFDLYIHDSWDGNKTGPVGPDLWQMQVDGAVFINATFSNDECTPGNFCPPQSYPFNYPNSYNNPKSGAYRTDLPGICGLTGPNGTTQYKISKTFSHSNSTLVLQCLDKLVQADAADQKCDESWSVDNINIKAVTL
jgi:hypothetical protein